MSTANTRFRRCAPLDLIRGHRRQGFVAVHLTPDSPWHNFVPVFEIGGKNPMEAGENLPRT
jgi:hypothetical protein